MSVPHLFQCQKDEALRPNRTAGLAEQPMSTAMVAEVLVFETKTCSKIPTIRESTPRGSPQHTAAFPRNNVVIQTPNTTDLVTKVKAHNLENGRLENKFCQTVRALRIKPLGKNSARC
jgi:hypothetical protein